MYGEKTGIPFNNAYFCVFILKLILNGFRLP